MAVQHAAERHAERIDGEFVDEKQHGRYGPFVNWAAVDDCVAVPPIAAGKAIELGGCRSIQSA
jgi:hypothetical protein